MKNAMKKIYIKPETTVFHYVVAPMMNSTSPVPPTWGSGEPIIDPSLAD